MTVLPSSISMLIMQVLTEKLGELCQTISFKRSMHWDGSTSFSRPVRWLFAMHGDCLLPFAFAGLRAQAFTRGLRGNSDLQISSQQSYWCDRRFSLMSTDPCGIAFVAALFVSNCTDNQCICKSHPGPS